jgi:AcrR family transcriptional regulator
MTLFRKASPGAGTPAAADSGTRTLILDTAARLFREEGYAATSLRDIAGECGIKAASLYHHFGSKDAIVGEVLRIGVERTFDQVRRAVLALPADADAATLLGTAVREHLEAMLERHDYTSANLRIFGQVPPEVRAAHLAQRDAYERFWGGLLQRCVDAGAIDPARKLSLVRAFLIGAMNSSLEWFDPGKAPIDDIAAELTAVFLDGLRPRAPARKAQRPRAPARKAQRPSAPARQGQRP